MKFKEFVCFIPALSPLYGPFLWHTLTLTNEEITAQEFWRVCSLSAAKCSIRVCQLSLRTYKGRKTGETDEQGQPI
jgi:hypothetical protein